MASAGERPASATQPNGIQIPASHRIHLWEMSAQSMPHRPGSQQRPHFPRQQVARLCGDPGLAVELAPGVIAGRFFADRPGFKPGLESRGDDLAGVGQIIDKFRRQVTIQARPERVDRSERARQPAAGAFLVLHPGVHPVIGAFGRHVSLAFADQSATRNQADIGIGKWPDKEANGVQAEVASGVGKYQDAGLGAPNEIIQYRRFSAPLRALDQVNARMICFLNNVRRVVRRSIRSNPHFDPVRRIIEGIKITYFFENSLFFVEGADKNCHGGEFVLRLIRTC